MNTIVYMVLELISGATILTLLIIAAMALHKYKNNKVLEDEE